MNRSFLNLLLAASAAVFTIAQPVDVQTTTVVDTPATTAPPHEARVAKQMTVKIVNNYGADIRTFHTGDFAVGKPGVGVISKGQMAHLNNMGDESLIEGSFVDQGNGFVGDVNISFVDGFSVPIICSCDANGLTTGCSKDLNKIAKCPAPNGQGSCKNPQRFNINAKSPTPYFAPCHAVGGAYTFPADDLSNNLNAKCPQEQYTCCVGTNCKKFPN
ncbi:hypothetical protein VHEMI09107 [[Torrubiella] hemipterigena]|uniref:Thaumatin-like protein n=1 Tax=[Torrubiella] hemipterigena TaxID=1531966 RepID=A0A0A1T8S9_9HYPO|nr:hypothetical protein VHEMI09107 [[Torrubiella] hemipterigena]